MGANGRDPPLWAVDNRYEGIIEILLGKDDASLKSINKNCTSFFPGGEGAGGSGKDSTRGREGGSS